MLVTLNFIASASYQTQIGSSELSNISQNSVSRTINEVSSLFTDYMMNEHISLATTFMDTNDKKSGYE